MTLWFNDRPREEDSPSEQTPTPVADSPPRHGPLSQETKARILALAQQGTPEEDIAREVGRSKEAVLRLLHGPKLRPHQWTSGSKARRPSSPEPGEVHPSEEDQPSDEARKLVRGGLPQPGPQPGAPPGSGAGAALLAHQFWIRPGVMVELQMPADLSPQEASRMAGLIRVLPFQS